MAMRSTQVVRDMQLATVAPTLLALVLVVAGMGVVVGVAADDEPFQRIARVGTTNFYRITNESAIVTHPTFFYKAQMTVDGDGAPNCYGPGDVGTLDFLVNAGHKGDWWAILTDNGETSGNPVVQKTTDPSPGLYISTTSLGNTSLPDSNPRKWVDATVIPYFVMPMTTAWRAATGAKLGDLGLVIWKDKWSYAIFADESGQDVGDHVGEGSVALSRRLGNEPLNANGKITNSIDNVEVYYFAFPGSGLGRVLTLDEIESLGAAAVESWGGLSKAQNVTAAWPWSASDVGAACASASVGLVPVLLLVASLLAL